MRREQREWYSIFESEVTYFLSIVVFHTKKSIYTTLKAHDLIWKTDRGKNITFERMELSFASIHLKFA